ncbi:SDR family NAD(P)-dependent oxidoreductase [Bacillus sp. es.036]|uniref:SDR family NAD(P)-dependent oxidoreductase n=1 Tax=Bacillus sp. es.036 TaxID=1761764 RepID=UPI000BF723F1|nr:SDR family oxidoreductase [Bacillus sp. es.036]PFG14427.1 3-oxoacyl-[acyl-carrier protein] reductase [Bacillus sp. es.036]
MTKKVALVTGSSKGLGKVIAQKLAESGIKVIINYSSNQDKAEAVVREIKELGGEAIAIQADITDQKDVERLVAVSRQTFQQPIDILVNNATGPQPELSLEEVTWEDYLDQLHFTVKAPLLLLKEVIEPMKENQWGRIINIGSEVVELGNSDFSNYVTAKSAIIGMTRSWANELGKHDITVNAVHPGFTPVERHGEVTETSAGSYIEGLPLNRLGKPEDIAYMVRFLASDEANFITGQNMNVNGGNTFGV